MTSYLFALAVLVGSYNLVLAANLSSKKKTWISSTKDPNSFSTFAVDGNNAKCAQTFPSVQPWWVVDLGDYRQVASVTVVKGQTTLSDFYIGVGSTDPTKHRPMVFGPNYQVCYHQVAEAPATNEYKCAKTLIGRYVIVQLRGSGVLMLCEVTVNGETASGISELAQGKPTSQSSTYSSISGSESAVDGNLDTNGNGPSCAHTNDDDDAWWSVDLGPATEVYHVKIVARGDCDCNERLSNFNIGVTDLSPAVQKPSFYNYQLCAHNPSFQGQGVTADYACPVPLHGRYVIVQLLNANILTLCEVQVFGRSAAD